MFIIKASAPQKATRNVIQDDADDDDDDDDDED